MVAYVKEQARSMRAIEKQQQAMERQQIKSASALEKMDVKLDKLTKIAEDTSGNAMLFAWRNVRYVHYVHMGIQLDYAVKLCSAILACMFARTATTRVV